MQSTQSNPDQEGYLVLLASDTSNKVVKLTIHFEGGELACSPSSIYSMVLGKMGALP